MKKFASIILKYRVIIIVLTILITIILGINLKDLKINSDVTTYLPQKDESVALFKYIGEEYSSSSTAIIIVESSEIFSKETIENINALTGKLRNTEGVEYVTSITNILDIKKTEEGFEISRLIDEYALPKTFEELAKIKKYTLSKDIYNGQIVSADSKFSIILCQINENNNKDVVARDVKKAVTDFNFPEKFYFEGMPYQFQSILDNIIDDLILLTPMIVVVIFLALYISFRSLRGVLLPIVSVAMGIIWTMSLMAIFGLELSPISDALPVVLFAVGSAYGIHVINAIKLKGSSTENKKEQLKKALSEVGLSVILAGVTTLIGFLSFTFGVYLNIVRDFGIFSALGVLFTLIISLTFIPAVVSFLPAENERTKKQVKRDLLSVFLSWLSVFVIKYKKAILFSSIIIMVVCFFGIPLIERKVDILEYFKPKTDVQVSANIMNKEFGGSLPIQILVKGDILTPLVLSKMEEVSTYFKSIKEVSNVRSIADYIEQMNDAMNEGKVIPDSREKIANLWFLIEGEDIMSQMINHDKNEAVIYGTMKNLKASQYHEINDSLNIFLKNLSNKEISFQATGMQAIYSKVDDNMMNNLIQSMVLSLILIFITMIFLIGSIKEALVGLNTLVFSIVFIFGFMGFVGIALDIATILIASITVGTGIDYSIHFITSYKEYLLKGLSIDEAIQETINSKGRAIVINVMTIILGFLVLLFANLIPLQQLGILIAVTLFCSGFGSITLMPAIISMFKINILKNKNPLFKEE